MRSGCELGEKLDEIAPFKEDALCFMANSGAEAVEAAIKLARYHSNRPRFIGFHGGFHGRTMGALAFTASKAVQSRGFFPTMAGVTHVPFPNPYRPRLAYDPAKGNYADAVIDYIENVIFAYETPPEDVAAFLVEPIQGEGGYVVPPDNFFPRLRRLCDKYGILLIVDEVQSGMGRTGKMFAIQHWGIEPDIVCIAKGIASGMPLGAMVARRSIMDWPAGAHGNTYGGNPLSCAAAIETIRLLESGLIENAAAVGAVHAGRAGGDRRSPPQHRRRARQGADDWRGVCERQRHQRARARYPRPDDPRRLRARAAAAGLRPQHGPLHAAADHHPGEMDEGLALFEDALHDAERAVLKNKV